MTIFDNYEVWFVIGSQHLYGAETLRQVTQHAEHVVNALNTEAKLPCKLVLKPLGTSPDEITAICRDANYDDRCAGLVVWLHTFSPAKMWINGLSILNKPLLQFHTQFNAALPWDSIDMDFMNLNQTAHGGREFGFIGARMRQQHAVVTGHWQDKEAHTRIGAWMRQAVSKQDTRQLKVCRFGDNMREVAVTDGDKVAAQIKFGFSVNTWAVGDLVQVVNSIGDGDINALIDEYESSYTLTPATQIHGDKRQNVREAARIELGMKRFLEQGGFHAFTTTFEDLHGLKQLPGLAVQRLMQQGYGFAGEGDWKNRRSASHYESDVNRSAGRHLIYGGLHLPLRERQRSGARLAHAGSVSVHRGGRETDPRRPAPRHWRQGRSGAFDFQYPNRPGDRRQPDRPRRSLSPAGQLH
ncbi:L-arabinose isomerase [Salmonella sp. NCTC 11881]|nr:L-arabinose isomerase [Salmonella sp. NCTC 11881]